MGLFRLCTFVRFETMIWPSIRFDYRTLKSLQTFFSPQIERKRSKEYLVIILAVKESFERFSCLKDFQRHFNTCLREWKLLSLYVFHRIIFLLLIVSSVFCNFHRCCAVCFQSPMNSIACRSSQNAARIKRFWRLHIVIKPLCWSV